MALAVDIVAAAATTGAVVVALWTSQRTLGLEQRALRADGRRQAALEIARWLQRAERDVHAWHDPEHWRVQEGVEFGAETGIGTGDVVPPSQGRMGPALQATIGEFESIRGLARLAFGPQHEVTASVGDVMDAVQHIADRGVIYAEEQGPTPRDYVDRTFRPLVADLFEALATASELRDAEEHLARSGVSPSDNKPPGYR